MAYYDRDDFTNDYTDNNSSNQTNYYQEQRRNQRDNLNQNHNSTSSSVYPPNNSYQSQFQPSQPYRNDYYDQSTDVLASNDALPINHSSSTSGRGAVREHNNYDGSYDENDGRGYSNENYEKSYPSGRPDGGVSSSKSSSSAKKWIIITAILLILIGAGVGAGIVVKSKLNSGSSNSSSSNSSSTGNTSTKGTSLQVIPGTAGAVLSNPLDPSQFQKDSRLHKSFYGIAYTPFNAQESQCGATLANITEDIQIMSQLTSRLRNYGSGCNQSALILQAIQDTKVNMTIWLGVYIGSNETVNTEQMEQTIKVIKTYGTSHIGGVSIGNEYILNSANQAIGTSYIVSKMATFRTMLAAAKITDVPVGTADAGSAVTAALSVGSDYVMANIHPFFGGLPISLAASWTWEFFQQNDIVYTDAAANKPIAYIAETGWPSSSTVVADCIDGGAVCGIPQSNEYLATYPCTANTNGTRYFYFEAFDEPWQASLGGIEAHWGIFTADKVLKSGLTLPTCISD